MLSKVVAELNYNQRVISCTSVPKEFFKMQSSRFSDLMTTNHWGFQKMPHRKTELHETTVIFPRADSNCLHSDLSLALRFIMSEGK